MRIEPRALARAGMKASSAWIEPGEASKDASGSRLVSARGRKPAARSAFTLVELVVVMAIVLVLMGLVLPGATTLWAERKVADAENVIQGLLVTTRARAQRPSATETGLFFYLDRSGAQQVAVIEQVNREAAVSVAAECNNDHPVNKPDLSYNREAWQDVFQVVGDSVMSLPPPMRVVPRYAVEADASPGMFTFSDDELANSDFEKPFSATFDVPQRHRNYFTIVFDRRGEVRAWRSVLILDYDRDGNRRGDVTGLPVGFDVNGNKPNVNKYFDIDGLPPLILAFPAKPTGGGEKETVCYLVVDDARSSDPVAINFPSVDGLLVYDDAAFVEAGDPAARRAYLLRRGQPFYVNRLTGAVIRGPVGESF